MLNGWIGGVLAGIQTFNQILTAGIAITAFSLLLYALSFNLRDRVARSFALILLCVVVVFTAEAVQNPQYPVWLIDTLQRVQWIGIVFLPATYLHLSDALLVTAGRPSKGRRRLAVRMTYYISAGFLVLLAFGQLLGPLVADGKPAPYLSRTPWTEVFSLYYIALMLLAGINFLRAYQRMLTRSGRRRMVYLMAGATAPALGSFPYLLYGSVIAAEYPMLFWTTAMLVNILVGALVVIMAYAVAFFGVSWPDRVVKTRLFKWILRGPVTASIVLAAMTVVRRAGEFFGLPYSAAVPAVAVGTILLLEHLITLAAPLWERWLFYGSDREQLLLLQNAEERFLTRSDLNQFIEAVLAAVRDHMQSPCTFVAARDENHLDLILIAGNYTLLDQNHLPDALEILETNIDNRQEFLWGDFLVLPLRAPREIVDRDVTPALLGFMGISWRAGEEMDSDQRAALWLLAERAALALEDRSLQKRVFQSLEDMQPKSDLLQKIRAAGRYDSKATLLAEQLPPESDLTEWVKDALTHYWGGPKLTQSPLLELLVVRETSKDHDGNMSNALRAILRSAVDRVRPEGERRFTTEWILYNILELKFIEGRRVRDVASRLAMSEADLYRKQRVAIEAVAQAIIQMEDEVNIEIGKEALKVYG